MPAYSVLITTITGDTTIYPSVQVRQCVHSHTGCYGKIKMWSQVSGSWVLTHTPPHCSTHRVWIHKGRDLPIWFPVPRIMPSAHGTQELLVGWLLNWDLHYSTVLKALHSQTLCVDSHSPSTKHLASRKAVGQVERARAFVLHKKGITILTQSVTGVILTDLCDLNKFT